jgi:hypothetical protein
MKTLLCIIIGALLIFCWAQREQIQGLRAEKQQLLDAWMSYALNAPTRVDITGESGATCAGTPTATNNHFVGGSVNTYDKGGRP